MTKKTKMKTIRTMVEPMLNRTMNTRRARALFRILPAVAILFALAALSCGGGGGSGTGIPTPTLSATFTPTTTNPAGAAVFMAAGSTSGAAFTLQVNAANITDFFGAGFRVHYDPAVATFLGSDSSGSVLIGTGVQTDFSTTVSSPGVLFVTATRVQANPFVPGVDITAPAELISLTFQAVAATGGSAITISDQEVQTCDSVTETCSSVAASWSAGTLTVN